MIEHLVPSGVSSSFALLVAAWLVSTLLYGLYNITIHPLRSYPGPLLWRMYRFPYARSLIAGRLPHDFLAIHKKYGPVVRVAPNELSYTDSRALKPIYGHHNPATEGFSEFDKDRLEYQMSLSGGYSILNAPTGIHGRFRKLFSHSFSDKGMRDMQPRIQGFVDLLLSGLKDEAKMGGYTDILKWYNWTTFDLIGELAFGECFHCLETKTTDPWIAAVFGNVKAVPAMHMIRTYGLAGLLPYLTPKKGREAREENLRRNVAKIEERLLKGSEQRDFMDNVVEKSLDEKSSAEGKGMTKAEMVANASILVLGGSETTATLLSGTTYSLCKNPEVMKKLNAEVRSAFKNEDEIDLLSVGKLEYMLAVLDEGMRVYPPVPNQGNRVVPKGGAMVADRWVPGGTSLQVQKYSTSYDPTNFTRPESFVPERWLPNPPVEFANDDRNAHAPFSLGPRNCIGRNLAYAEMRLILAKICWNFDVELDEERSGDWFDQKIFGLWEKKPLWVKLKSVR
ncbi:cytochrome P450 [Lophiostoma macrostomum CBS 122681]|uniref:Cytochrome P450 n=1 Tax=Lophiostoma macrostomum CBS 122681 TaxID=1314788 RepID=A0A6A6TBZ5_9PLEO|nr:cytochrome P450 [Lophiostoma macrostomum CBS 122681]